MFAASLPRTQDVARLRAAEARLTVEVPDEVRWRGFEFSDEVRWRGFELSDEVRWRGFEFSDEVRWRGFELVHA